MRVGIGYLGGCSYTGFGRVLGCKWKYMLRRRHRPGGTEGCGKPRALPQHSKPTRPHAQQDISKEVSKGYCRAIKIAFHLTLPREPTPPTTFGFILPLLKSVVSFFVACSGVHDYTGLRITERAISINTSKIHFLGLSRLWSWCLPELYVVRKAKEFPQDQIWPLVSLRWVEGRAQTPHVEEV